ncbi:hypothetical protein C6501_05030 [Candidatus Poribacteria bacterium]|nr:MAG: hypothetical protein C6501_05030 [Candidatus Poribacteria bacterium]
MRFKNLTIILTLTCLSIAAFVGLALLPITGNCALINHGWTYSNNNTAANFSAIETTQGASWQLYAFVDAKGVSASVSPDDYNLSHFTQSTVPPFTGTGWVTAFRDNYTYTHWHGIYFGRHSHTVIFDIDTNHPSSPYLTRDANGKAKSTALTLDIQVSKTVKHTCVARKKGTEVGAGTTIPLPPFWDEIGPNIKFKLKKVTYISESKSDKTTVYVPTVAQKVGVTAGVGSMKEANSSAHAIINFEGLSDSGSVWYNAP